MFGSFFQALPLAGKTSVSLSVVIQKMLLAYISINLKTCLNILTQTHFIFLRNTNAETLKKLVKGFYLFIIMLLQNIVTNSVRLKSKTLIPVFIKSRWPELSRLNL